MKIKFGEFEEVESVESVQKFLTEYFESFKSKDFDSVYIAYPHQCFSDDYVPSRESERQLEIYLYSLPSKIKGEPKRGDSLYYDENTGGELINGQRDFLSVTAVPAGYKLCKDIDTKPFAVCKDNQIWILYDIGHKLGVDNSVKTSSLKMMLDGVNDQFLDPPSQEDLEKRFLKALGQRVSAETKNMMKDAEANIKKYEVDLKASEDRVRQLMRSFASQRDLLEALKLVPTTDVTGVLDKVRKMPMVKKMEFAGKSIQVETNPITLGPLNFGTWQITLRDDLPSFTHSKFSEVLHPYEYSHHAYCMGGWTDSYMNAMKQGQLDVALAICKMEIVNYELSTKMNLIEPFLTAMMGKKVLWDLYEKIRKDKFKDCDTIQISEINGKDVTFVGKQANTRTQQREVISFD